MSLGIIMLVHADLWRATQLAKHWSNAGCPIAIHVDKAVSKKDFAAFKESLEDYDDIIFSKRRHIEWGTWSLVNATLGAATQLLDTHDDIEHVYLASGSCLPLRPIADLMRYLQDASGKDFIESVATKEVPWAQSGLDEERFTLRFPFAWRKHRKLFDRYVSLQRRLRYKRKLPYGLAPHMGSQWWCLSRQTLSAILNDPDRRKNDAYFKRVWIPDESYFQTLARKHSKAIESRSLTLSKFDFQGKPHLFYDDHLQLLRRSDCFVARKIWPHANTLYTTFLSVEATRLEKIEPRPEKINHIFAKAFERRTQGRPGLVMQSRFPRENFENGRTTGTYTVFEGFSELFEGFNPWLCTATSTRVHGALFHNDRVQFDQSNTVYTGGLSDSAKIRDYNPKAFLYSLLWNTRGEHMCFQFGPTSNQTISWDMALDRNARINVVSGAWAVPLFKSDMNFKAIREEAAKLQRIETAHINILRSPYVKARVRIWQMAEFVENPMEPLQQILQDFSGRATPRHMQVPKLVDLTGFGEFLQKLKNRGMYPHFMGDFPTEDVTQPIEVPARQPYSIKK
ncbi:MAG: beta-1,6-N-acetylglucosaminyltransferase [Halocynthiibacter sp.]